MAETSVTGVGPGSSSPSSEHHTLGVSHLIGPRWDEEKEKEFKQLKDTVNGIKITVRIINAIVSFALGASLAYMYNTLMR